MKLEPKVFLSAAQAIKAGQFSSPVVAVMAAAKAWLPPDTDASEWTSAHIAMLYWAYAPGGKRRMTSCFASDGKRRWFNIGLDLSHAAQDAHPWWSKTVDQTTEKVTEARIAALTDVADRSERFVLPSPRTERIS